MKVLYTSDIHTSRAHLYSMLLVAEKEKVDAVIIGGDIVPHRLPDSVSGKDELKSHARYLEEIFVPTLRKFIQKTGTAFFLDLGNDDLFYTRNILEIFDGRLFKLLHFKKRRFTADMDIMGYMVVPPTPFARKDLEKPDTPLQPCAPNNRITLEGHTSTDGVLKEVVLDLNASDTMVRDLEQLSATVERPFIFVSHSPPYDTPLDVLHNGTHVGSVAIAEFIRKWAKKGKLLASFHGHIHESPLQSGSIHTKMEGVMCFNPGQGNKEGSGFRYVIVAITGERPIQETDILKIGS